MKKARARMAGTARFVITIYGLAKLLQLQAARHRAFREQLKRHDLTPQMRLLDGSHGRLIVFRDASGAEAPA